MVFPGRYSGRQQTESEVRADYIGLFGDKKPIRRVARLPAAGRRSGGVCPRSGPGRSYRRYYGWTTPSMTFGAAVTVGLTPM